MGKAYKLACKLKLAWIKTTRIMGTKIYMRSYTKYLQNCGMNIADYNGDGFIAPDVYLDDSDYGLITIGGGVTMAKDVIVLTHDYSIRRALCVIGRNPEMKNYRFLRPVEIGKNCFIGARSIILPDTRMGDNVIIAAGSIVKGDVPPNSVWGGGYRRIICAL